MTFTIKKPKSAKEINVVLDNYYNFLIQGGITNQQVINDTARIVLEDPEADEAMKAQTRIDGGVTATIARYYWEFRDELQEYQKKHNISSIQWKTVIWSGEELRFPVISDQLQCLEQDLKVAQRYKRKVVSKFLDFCNRHHLQIQDSRGNLSTPDTVLQTSLLYQWATLGEVEEDTVNTSKFFYQIEFGLLLMAGDTEDPRKECVLFYAT